MNAANRTFPLARVVLACLGVGLLVAASIMYAAWEHNPQGEFHDETGVHWGGWLGLGFAWFVATGLVPAALCVCSVRLCHRG